jgi:hypothetical protein
LGNDANILRRGYIFSTRKKNLALPLFFYRGMETQMLVYCPRGNLQKVRDTIFNFKKRADAVML